MNLGNSEPLFLIIVLERVISRASITLGALIALFAAFYLAKTRIASSDYAELSTLNCKIIFKNFGPASIFLIISVALFYLGNKDVDVAAVRKTLSDSPNQIGSGVYYHSGVNPASLLTPTCPSLENLQAFALARETLSAAQSQASSAPQKANLNNKMIALNGQIKQFIERNFSKRIVTKWTECLDSSQLAQCCRTGETRLNEDECSTLNQIVESIGAYHE